jgi:hypothetical protein
MCRTSCPANLFGTPPELVRCRRQREISLGHAGAHESETYHACSAQGGAQAGDLLEQHRSLNDHNELALTCLHKLAKESQPRRRDTGDIIRDEHSLTGTSQTAVALAPVRRSCDGRTNDVPGVARAPEDEPFPWQRRRECMHQRGSARSEGRLSARYCDLHRGTG